jgi:hypothetical protein
MSERKLADCPLCKHPEADLEHYRKEHPLPTGGGEPRGSWMIDWEGQPYITYSRGHPH